MLKTWAPDKSGSCLVLLRITAGNERKYFSTGQTSKPQHWNEKKYEANSRHPDRVNVNAAIDAAVALAKKARNALQLAGHPVTASAIRGESVVYAV